MPLALVSPVAVTLLRPKPGLEPSGQGPDPQEEVPHVLPDPFACEGGPA